ncbi:MAG: hypothetical protein JOZ55_05445 [Alphaproteobacteria bacterium]|nr:hypothetical protein [Alphaproteobacteria bacterium]
MSIERVKHVAEEDIEALRAQSPVILSPHFDDACFSLGGLLERTGCGLVINIFTRSLYAPGDASLAASDADRIHRLRAGEDLDFARRCQLERIDLEADEPALRGRRPNDASGIAEDIASIRSRLLATLGELNASPGSRRVLFAPLGIGRHANHLAVSMLVQGNFRELSRKFRICLYEDLPYAYNPLQRRKALARMRAGNITLDRRHVFPISWRKKRSLVSLYPSQFRGGPQRWKFRPAARTPLGMHEAFWTTCDPASS